MQVKGQGELNEHVIFESNDAVCRKLSYQNWSKVGAFFGDTVYKSCGQIWFKFSGSVAFGTGTHW